MGRLSIQLGKAWSSIRRDGILRGGKRILSSVPLLLRRAGAGDILFVASGVGDSARYRCDHIAESLRFHGLRASVISQDSPFLSRSVDSFSAFVFHRTSRTSLIGTFIELLKAKKKTIIFDTDDLVFDADIFRETAAYEAMNSFEKKQYDRGVGDEFLRDPGLSAVTTSTEFLAERLRAFGKPVFILPNRLSRKDVETADGILFRASNRKASERNPDEISIGYFSGSTGHDRDFSVVAPVLARLLDEVPSLRIFVGGPLTLPNILDGFSSRIDRSAFVPRNENFENIANVDINIAPLEVGDPFCESKSELKFFEAGIVGVPTVASATRTFRSSISDGVDGFVAEREDEWYKKLEKLVRNADFRKNIGMNARKTALRKYVSDTADNGEYVDFLRTRL